jgi:hypothetical protein
MSEVKRFNDFGKSKISEKFIKSWKPVFDAYPELNAVPVYAWGRYYKYELSGEPFETYIEEDGISKFRNMIDDNLQWNIIKKIDEEHNKKGGNLWQGKWGGYSPLRDDVVKAFGFDGRGGMCIIIYRKGDDFDLKVTDCDSPE